MANEFEGERSRRRYDRALGPFDGTFEGPMLVYDLNVGGGFITSPHQPLIGSTLALKINLPQDGWISVNAEVLYQYEHGFAVQFVDLDGATASRIARTVEAFRRK
jgi:hypothetical protein